MVTERSTIAVAGIGEARIVRGGSIGTLLPAAACLGVRRGAAPGTARLAGAVASAAVFFGYYLGIVAMRIGEIAVVAPFRYSTILLALLLGYLLWGFVPDAISLGGIAIVIGSGLYLLRRERAVLARQRSLA